MKNSLLVITLVFSFCHGAIADTGHVSGAAAKKLASLLSGKTLRCTPSGIDSLRTEAERKQFKKISDDFGDGFFPFRVKATQAGTDDVKLSVRCATPSTGWGVGGDELEVQASPDWLIISSGDDGRQYAFLQLNKYSVQSADCDADKTNLEGNIYGVVASEWEGIRASQGIQCCLEK